MPGAFDYPATVTCSPLYVCTSVRLALWGVGQLADRPAVNREVGGSSPPAPASSSTSTSRSPCHVPRLAHSAVAARGAVVALYRVGPVSRDAVPALQWARVNADLNLRLRRGAWYRVLELHPLEAVLGLRRRGRDRAPPRL